MCRATDLVTPVLVVILGGSISVEGLVMHLGVGTTSGCINDAASASVRPDPVHLTQDLSVVLRHRLRSIARVTTAAARASVRSPSLRIDGTSRGAHPYRPAGAARSLRTRRREGLGESAASRAAHRGSRQGASARPVDSRPGRGSRRFVRVRP